MATKAPKNPPPDSNTVQPPVPLPEVPAEVLHGLEAIRIHGGNDDELYLSAEGSFFEASFMTDRIVTAEESVRFIKKIEALIRGSVEYKGFISYLRNDLCLDRCSFLSKLDMGTDEITLEMHHAPINLFQIVDIVINHRLNRSQPVTSMSVADEVMRMHYENKVGIVPLSRSAHKLVHAGVLNIHPAMVHGDWMGLLRDYPDGVTEELVNRLIEFTRVSVEDVASKAVKIDGSISRPLLQDDVTIPTKDQLLIILSA